MDPNTNPSIQFSFWTNPLFFFYLFNLVLWLMEHWEEGLVCQYVTDPTNRVNMVCADPEDSKSKQEVLLNAYLIWAGIIRLDAWVAYIVFVAFQLFYMTRRGKINKIYSGCASIVVQIYLNQNLEFLDLRPFPHWVINHSLYYVEIVLNSIQTSCKCAIEG